MRGLVIGLPLGVLLWVALFGIGTLAVRAIQAIDLPPMHLGGEP